MLLLQSPPSFAPMSSHSEDTTHSVGPNNCHEEKAMSTSTTPGPKPRKYAHSFWDKEVAHLRAVLFKLVIGSTVLTILVCWICLPLYWGSLWKSNRYTDKLAIRVLNYDGGSLGEAVVKAALANRNDQSTRSKLGYFVSDTSAFPNIQSIEDDVVNEGSWGALVIRQGATAALETARQIGNASYDPSHAIDFYYSQARNEQATGSYIVPLVQQLLSMVTVQYSAQSAAGYLRDNANNATALSLLAQAPRTISGGVAFTMVNLRPYNQPVAAAITLVGLIYMLIFSFIVTMSFNAAREMISPYLTTASYIKLRLIVPMICYAFISFFFAMVNLPFKVHFGAHFTYAGGFFLWWITLWLGMASVGLATEFFITVLTPRFVAFSLFPLIIANVSVAVLPHELQPWLFRYGAAMPFYNAGRVVRTIIFNTRNQIGQNIGILIAWVVVSFITIPLATWFFRRNAVNAHRRETGENQLDQVDGQQLA